ncbi:MAG: EF-P beta-lysylation protein EpmB [Pirellula sp.]
MSSQSPHSTWQQAMKNAIRDSTQLCKALDLDPAELRLSRDGEDQFPVFVPHEFLRRMRRGDPNDPLLLQVLPRLEESMVVPDDALDPVGDQLVEMVPGLLHKYQGRVLLILSGACAVHCRYCFRRHYPYGLAPKSFEQWKPALDYIANDPSVHEVILSGGDPLTISDSQLSQLSERLESISHVRRLRIHTRFPVVIPQRIDANLCRWLSESRLSKWVVLHINHPNEIDLELVQAIGRLRAIGCNVLNQAVLLRGINDQLDTLARLCEQLIDLGVIPYYLHQLDRVAGASHFEVDPEDGLKLVGQLASLLPGYAVPNYVREIAGEPSKTPMELQPFSNVR